MQIVFSGFRIPALRGVGSSCLYEPEADDLTIAQVMVLVDQRVVEGFEFCVSDRFEINKAKIGQSFLKGGLIDINDGDTAIAFFIVGTGESWRKSDKTFSFQGQQQLTTCHVL